MSLLTIWLFLNNIVAVEIFGLMDSLQATIFLFYSMSSTLIIVDQKLVQRSKLEKEFSDRLLCRYRFLSISTKSNT